MNLAQKMGAQKYFEPPKPGQKNFFELRRNRGHCSNTRAKRNNSTFWSERTIFQPTLTLGGAWFQPAAQPSPTVGDSKGWSPKQLLIPTWAAGEILTAPSGGFPGKINFSLRFELTRTSKTKAKSGQNQKQPGRRCVLELSGPGGISRQRFLATQVSWGTPDFIRLRFTGPGFWGTDQTPKLFS